MNNKRPNDPSAPSTAAFNWYPGHMAKALREIKEKLKMVDVIFEVRDARVPLTSGNTALKEVLGSKLRIIVLNKVNLSDLELVSKWEDYFKAQEEPFLFVNCLDKGALKKALTMARRLIIENRRRCDPGASEQIDKLRLMIIGLPNTGKSTIINQLSNKNSAKVADKPGQTQVQQWIKLENNVELLDTPGVMPPEIEKKEQVLWLSAIHAIPDEIAGEQDTACYLIQHFLKKKNEEFQTRYKLPDFNMGLDEALLKIASVRGCLRQGGVPDLDRVYKLVLMDFRKGELGRTCFEKP